MSRKRNHTLLPSLLPLPSHRLLLMEMEWTRPMLHLVEVNVDYSYFLNAIDAPNTCDRPYHCRVFNPIDLNDAVLAI